jgi:tetratricopeptide (TPR) repeat protein
MKKAFFLIGLALLGQAAPGRAAPPERVAAPAAPAPPAVQAPAPTAQEIEASRQAVAGADVQRLITDRAYAATILAHIDRIAPAAQQDNDVSLALDNMRLFALIPQQRPDDLRAEIDRLVAQRPVQAPLYAGAWVAALSLEDLDRALAVVETASRNVSGTGWATLRGLLEDQVVGIILQRFHAAHQEEKRVAMAQALFRIGWPGGSDAETADFIRSILIEDRMRQHDGAEAANLVLGIATPGQMLSMMVQKRYDPILPSGREPLTMLQEMVAAQDRATAEALAAAPQDLRRVLDRVHFLRGQGREADALALVMPFTRDVRATIAAANDGMWVINEGSYALFALGRKDQAVALMRRLVAVPIDSSAGLIGPFINHSVILNEAGRYAEALDYARTLERDSGHYANDYGRMWIASSVVCALAGLNRAAEAAPDLERLRAHVDVNPAALTRAYLCVGDDAALAALMIHRLQSDDPESAILSLQDYALSRTSDQRDPIFSRWQVMRDRADVREALGRVGRIYTLPLARSYYGSL